MNKKLKTLDRSGGPDGPGKKGGCTKYNLGAEKLAEVSG